MSARVSPPGSNRRRWTTFIALWVTTLGLALGAWQAPGRAESRQGPRGAASVMIKNFEFAPQTLTIAGGGIVRWINADVANHQISSGGVERDRPRPDGRISSPLLFRGDEFTVTVTTPGEYPYHCAVHPFMRGTVVVK